MAEIAYAGAGERGALDMAGCLHEAAGVETQPS